MVGPQLALAREGCLLHAVTFVHGPPTPGTFATEVALRYRAPLVPATLTLLEENEAWLQFQMPQVRVTPGQSAVFYRGEEVIGGGLIAAESRSVSPAGIPSSAEGE